MFFLASGKSFITINYIIFFDIFIISRTILCFLSIGFVIVWEFVVNI